MSTIVSGRRSHARAGTALLFSFLFATAAAPAAACDVCAVYTATEQRQGRTGPYIGVAEQLSRFTTLQRDGEEVANVADERLVSSITQVLLGYNLTPRFGLQLNLPIISRTFRRLEGDHVVHDDETGIGDLSLLGTANAFTRVGDETVFRLTLLGGLKLPSGDASRLGEELEEGHHHGSGEARPPAGVVIKHSPSEPGEPAETPGGALESGIHGHDLALGSGSVDGVIGGQLFWSWRRLYVTLGAQYAIRSEGDFDYRYANDLTWTGGPGVMALLEHGYSLGLQAVVTGETKGKDELDGVPADDTGITAVYVGPEITFTWGSSLGADLVLDVPVVQNNTALQIVADYRIRAGLTWHF
jgi:hypothetical protein